MLFRIERPDDRPLGQERLTKSRRDALDRAG
jgi:hypothetical protein